MEPEGADLDDIIAAAAEIAQTLLSPLPSRLNHVVGVGEAATLTFSVTHERVSRLRAAALLHDIGYAPALQDTGFHPIDGARYLREIGCRPDVINLVAHHSCARVEAKLRGLGRYLEQEFPYDPSLPHDELCYCDMTTTPEGKPTTVEQRIEEILARYGPGSIVHSAIAEARAELVAAVRRTEAKLNLGGSPGRGSGSAGP